MMWQSIMIYSPSFFNSYLLYVLIHTQVKCICKYSEFLALNIYYLATKSKQTSLRKIILSQIKQINFNGTQN